MRRNVAKLTLRITLLLAGFAAARVIQQAPPAWAHGANIKVLPQAVEIVATFDTGEPMANAQVSVYAPDELETPWQSGQTDSEGRFLFAPEAAAPEGTWEVIVRKAGHGQTTTFDLGSVDLASVGLGSAASGATASVNSPAQNSTAQKWFGVAAIVWGCIGTSLYFLRKGDSSNRSQKQPVDPIGSPVDSPVGSPAEGKETVVAATSGEYR